MSILENIPFIGKLIDDYGENLVVKGIEKLTGIDISKKDLTPEEQQKILDNEFRIKSLNFEELKLEFENTNNARIMYKEKNATADRIAIQISVWNLPLIILLIIINVIAVDYLNDVKLAIVSNFIGIAIKTLFDERATVINFFFGSSKGSTDKQDVINQLKGK